MSTKGKEDEIQDLNKNILYYDAIASIYDSILNENTQHKFIRKKVAEKFTHLVKNGCVLEFGGGTGQDLEWLSKMGYKIFFCEPSSEMRQLAINRFNSQFPLADITFFENNQVDFSTWNSKNPFSTKVDAILANLAVFNCIYNIKSLFDNLALITKSGSTVIALLLDYSFLKRLKMDFSGSLKGFLFHKPMRIEVKYGVHDQLVYLHTKQSIKKASRDNFEIKQIEQLEGLGFYLLHLTRK